MESVTNNTALSLQKKICVDETKEDNGLPFYKLYCKVEK